MQIDGVKLQVSIFKDLVTLADPKSPYSFLSYLHENKRLYHFLNAQYDAVSRREFANYIAWVSQRLPSVGFDEASGRFFSTALSASGTDKRTLRARNVSIAVGKTPKVPSFIEDKLCASLFHSADFTMKGRALGGKRVVIVGGGQSGAEVFLDCISRRGADAPAHVHWVSSRSNFLPIDDSPFTNDLFMPCQVAHFERQDAQAREAYLRENMLASDGISLCTLRAIYQKLYERRFIDGQEGVATLSPNRRVTMAAQTPTHWLLGIRHKGGGGEELVCADTVVFATGYRDGDTPFLDGLRDRLDHVGGEIRVDEDYAAVWDGPANRSVFVQNAARGQKGLADPNLSLLAWRAQRIVHRILGRAEAASAHPSFIAWTSEEPRVDALKFA
jgi:lysine N6-hydroxylase